MYVFFVRWCAVAGQWSRHLSVKFIIAVRSALRDWAATRRHSSRQLTPACRHAGRRPTSTGLSQRSISLLHASSLLSTAATYCVRCQQTGRSLLTQTPNTVGKCTEGVPTVCRELLLLLLLSHDQHGSLGLVTNPRHSVLLLVTSAAPLRSLPLYFKMSSIHLLERYPGWRSPSTRERGGEQRRPVNRFRMLYNFLKGVVNHADPFIYSSVHHTLRWRTTVLRNL